MSDVVSFSSLHGRVVTLEERLKLLFWLNAAVELPLLFLILAKLIE